MRERAHADDVHAEFGEPADAVQRDSSRYLDDGFAAGSGERFGELGVGEIVEHDDVGSRRERLVETLQRLDLDFDTYGVGGARLGASDGGGDAARSFDVVVLDEHASAQRVAVVVAASAADGVTLQGA
jgi:hypothetical protein